jgi:hypothetical protein
MDVVLTVVELLKRQEESSADAKYVKKNIAKKLLMIMQKNFIQIKS